MHNPLILFFLTPIHTHTHILLDLFHDNDNKMPYLGNKKRERGGKRRKENTKSIHFPIIFWKGKKKYLEKSKKFEEKRNKKIHMLTSTLPPTASQTPAFFLISFKNEQPPRHRCKFFSFPMVICYSRLALLA
ncbi:hypothetical protein F4809DRAFT_621151 [Biscogniauxia mediterranea]|nr:hypothetical protein F4809DRAFT_621151 [Biscogniauxia mediterranea]